MGSSSSIIQSPMNFPSLLKSEQKNNRRVIRIPLNVALHSVLVIQTKVRQYLAKIKVNELRSKRKQEEANAINYINSLTEQQRERRLTSNSFSRFDDHKSKSGAKPSNPQTGGLRKASIMALTGTSNGFDKLKNLSKSQESFRFIPFSAFVIRTKFVNSNKKVFINICHHPQIDSLYLSPLRLHLDSSHVDEQGLVKFSQYYIIDAIIPSSRFEDLFIYSEDGTYHPQASSVNQSSSTSNSSSISYHPRSLSISSNYSNSFHQQTLNIIAPSGPLLSMSETGGYICKNELSLDNLCQEVISVWNYSTHITPSISSSAPNNNNNSTQQELNNSYYISNEKFHHHPLKGGNHSKQDKSDEDDDDFFSSINSDDTDTDSDSELQKLASTIDHSNTLPYTNIIRDFNPKRYTSSFNSTTKVNNNAGYMKKKETKSKDDNDKKEEVFFVFHIDKSYKLMKIKKSYIGEIFPYFYNPQQKSLSLSNSLHLFDNPLLTMKHSDEHNLPADLLYFSSSAAGLLKLEENLKLSKLIGQESNEGSPLYSINQNENIDSSANSPIDEIVIEDGQVNYPSVPINPICSQIIYPPDIIGDMSLSISCVYPQATRLFDPPYDKKKKNESKLNRNKIKNRKNSAKTKFVRRKFKKRIKTKRLENGEEIELKVLNNDEELDEEEEGKDIFIKEIEECVQMEIEVDDPFNISNDEEDDEEADTFKDLTSEQTHYLENIRRLKEGCSIYLEANLGVVTCYLRRKDILQQSGSSASYNVSLSSSANDGIIRNTICNGDSEIARFYMSNIALESSVDPKNNLFFLHFYPLENNYSSFSKIFNYFNKEIFHSAHVEEKENEDFLRNNSQETTSLLSKIMREDDRSLLMHHLYDSVSTNANSNNLDDKRLLKMKRIFRLKTKFTLQFHSHSEMMSYKNLFENHLYYAKYNELKQHYYCKNISILNNSFLYSSKNKISLYNEKNLNLLKFQIGDRNFLNFLETSTELGYTNLIQNNSHYLKVSAKSTINNDPSIHNINKVTSDSESDLEDSEQSNEYKVPKYKKSLHIFSTKKIELPPINPPSSLSPVPAPVPVPDAKEKVTSINSIRYFYVTQLLDNNERKKIYLRVSQGWIGLFPIKNSFNINSYINSNLNDISTNSNSHFPPLNINQPKNFHGGVDHDEELDDDLSIWNNALFKASLFNTTFKIKKKYISKTKTWLTKFILTQSTFNNINSLIYAEKIHSPDEKKSLAATSTANSNSIFNSITTNFEFYLRHNKENDDVLLLLIEVLSNNILFSNSLVFQQLLPWQVQNLLLLPPHKEGLLTGAMPSAVVPSHTIITDESSTPSYNSKNNTIPLWSTSIGDQPIPSVVSNHVNVMITFQPSQSQDSDSDNELANDSVDGEAIDRNYDLTTEGMTYRVLNYVPNSIPDSDLSLLQDEESRLMPIPIVTDSTPIDQSNSAANTNSNIQKGMANTISATTASTKNTKNYMMSTTVSSTKNQSFTPKQPIPPNIAPSSNASQLTRNRKATTRASVLNSIGTNGLSISVKNNVSKIKKLSSESLNFFLNCYFNLYFSKKLNSWSKNLILIYFYKLSNKKKKKNLLDNKMDDSNQNSLNQTSLLDPKLNYFCSTLVYYPQFHLLLIYFQFKLITIVNLFKCFQMPEVSSNNKNLTLKKLTNSNSNKSLASSLSFSKVNLNKVMKEKFYNIEDSSDDERSDYEIEENKSKFSEEDYDSENDYEEDEDLSNYLTEEDESVNEDPNIKNWQITLLCFDGRNIKIRFSNRLEYLQWKSLLFIRSTNKTATKSSNPVDTNSAARITTLLNNYNKNQLPQTFSFSCDKEDSVSVPEFTNSSLNSNQLSINSNLNNDSPNSNTASSANLLSPSSFSSKNDNEDRKNIRNSRIYDKNSLYKTNAKKK